MIKKKTRTEKIIDRINACPEDKLKEAMAKAVIDIEAWCHHGYCSNADSSSMNLAQLDIVFNKIEYNLKCVEESNNG